MDIKKLYEDWCKNATDDKDLISELESIKNDENEIQDKVRKLIK